MEIYQGLDFPSEKLCFDYGEPEQKLIFPTDAFVRIESLYFCDFFGKPGVSKIVQNKFNLGLEKTLTLVEYSKGLPFSASQIQICLVRFQLKFYFSTPAWKLEIFYWSCLIIYKNGLLAGLPNNVRTFQPFIIW